MPWLADELANIRSLARVYSERGDAMWSELNQSDPEMHRWYYRTVAETVELQLNRTGAFKGLLKHINFIWPGTFDSERAGQGRRGRALAHARGAVSESPSSV